ncbi:uncharacterized protein LOC119125349 isoform X2 [Syngnathus acus]|uniref:uncharacterized protein LOC119125349 isoform X2 n=1 Tax=Syngnathus acus TaxID=161584 RepID=UPI001886307E|nr:uncharacterized protein LOC119125349 isoform X2 [Syngnathus acus]
MNQIHDFVSILEKGEKTSFAEDCAVSTLKRKASNDGAQTPKRRRDMMPSTSEQKELAWHSLHMSVDGASRSGTGTKLNPEGEVEQPDASAMGRPAKVSTRKSNTRSVTLKNKSESSKKANAKKKMQNIEADSSQKNQSSKPSEGSLKSRAKSAKETDTLTMKQKGKPIQAGLTKGSRRTRFSRKTETPTKKARAKPTRESLKPAPSKGNGRKSNIKPQKKKDKYAEGSEKAVPRRTKRKSEPKAFGKKPRKPSEGQVRSTSPKATKRKPSTKPKKTEEGALVKRTKKRSGQPRHTLAKKSRHKPTAKNTPAVETDGKSDSVLASLSKQVSKIPSQLSVVFFGEPKKEASPEPVTSMESSSDVPPGSTASQQSTTNRGNLPFAFCRSTFKAKLRQRSCLISAASFARKYQQVNKLGEGGFGSVYAGYRKSDCLPVAIKYIPKEVKRVPLNINGLKKDIPIEALLMLQASIKKNSDGTSAVVSLLNKYDLEHQIVLVMERPVPSVDLFTYITRCRIAALPECEAKVRKRHAMRLPSRLHVCVRRTEHHEAAGGGGHRHARGGRVPSRPEARKYPSGGHVRRPSRANHRFRLQLLRQQRALPGLQRYDAPLLRLLGFRRSSGFLAGTLCYAPPEYVLRRTYSAGPTTVWHLGALLFELMAGTKRFDTVMFLSQMLRLNRVLSEECEDFLWKCLNLDPEKRATLEQMQQHPWLI